MLLQIPNRQGLSEPKPGDTITIGWAEDAGLVYPRATEILGRRPTGELTIMTCIHRRDLIKGAGAAALAAGLGPPAFAQSGGRVVVGTWGGDYARLLTKNIEDPILKPKGIEIVQDQAGDAPRRAKMVANGACREARSTSRPFRRQHVRDERGRRGRADRLRQVPNAKNLLPTMKPLRHRRTSLPETW